MLTSPLPRVILIDVIAPTLSKAVAKRRLIELTSLTHTYGGMVVVKLIQKRNTPDYQTYIGSGKVKEIMELAEKEAVDLLIVNNLLKPKQLFALEEAFRLHAKEQTTQYPSRHHRISYPRVWDRIDLILKIFDKHAKTAEAKLQIKLAAIQHMGPRIFGMGMELMQQGGGIGTRGQGETNTEVMRRHLAEQEKQVKKQLAHLASGRALQRKRRDRLGMKTVSVVGYTNAGKSSLVNALTQKGAYVADALFATLDTRVGKLSSPGIPSTILVSDTIGFIQDLPPELISAFRSTLDETIDADLLLHVIDVSDPYLHEKIKEVEAILKQLHVADKPKIYVFNKIDLVKRVPKTTLKKTYADKKPIFVSCVSGNGINDLKEVVADFQQASSRVF